MEATGGLITCRREAGKTGWKMGDVFHLLWCVCGGKGSGVPVCKRWRGRAPRPPRNTPPQTGHPTPVKTSGKGKSEAIYKNPQSWLFANPRRTFVPFE